MKLWVLALLITSLMIFSAGAGESDAEATRAAEAWLALVDSAKYAQSWSSASAAFKKAVTEEDWVKTISIVRAQLGKSESRKLSLSQALKDPPNAPAGDYLILQYTSNFAKKNDAVETVVMGVDADKQWRTSGYFVK